MVSAKIAQSRKWKTSFYFCIQKEKIQHQKCSDGWEQMVFQNFTLKRKEKLSLSKAFYNPITPKANKIDGKQAKVGFPICMLYHFLYKNQSNCSHRKNRVVHIQQLK